jgi:hypothetical protein
MRNHASILQCGAWPLSCRSPLFMLHAALRAKIRELMASGTLPPESSETLTAFSRQPIRVKRIIIGRATLEPCLICGEPDPVVSYVYSDWRVVRLHATCDELWRQERTAEP